MLTMHRVGKTQDETNYVRAKSFQHVYIYVVSNPFAFVEAPYENSKS